ncbi:saccharopine dehydrogenase family protein [Pseudactinotalea sp. Z1739]|uniref:saccharopine dehydrogenase family protein n=1 Tax=Pseudactinotalea sp. Z1739 TaxID=3413028 RepID=UPI003C7C9620
MTQAVLVFGAYGHTGRFVVAELLRRGLEPVLAGRNALALAGLEREYPGLHTRVATVEDEASLRAATRGVTAVVNCAGPFIDTGSALVAAAIHADAHYLDVSAEQASVGQIYRDHQALPRHAGVSVIPAMAFYGGLADLLVSAVTAGWADVDSIEIFNGLDRWWPTAGTRSTGKRNTAPRLVIDDGRLVPAPLPATTRHWEFPYPLGSQWVVASPFSEMVTLARHVEAGSVRTFLSRTALADVRDQDTPGPVPVEESGRSAQQFVVDVVARRGATQRRICATGRDIYAVTAPLVAEAIERLLHGHRLTGGVAAPGEAFSARSFLDALHPEHMSVNHFASCSAKAVHGNA